MQPHAHSLIPPLIEYLVLAAAFCACLYLFGSLKIEARRVQKRADASRSVEEEQIKALIASIREIQDKLEAIENGRIAVAASRLDGPARAQALRMLRRGLPSPTIAGTLEIPLNEVQLLAKMQRLANGGESALARSGAQEG